jgi:hypothetical protein
MRRRLRHMQREFRLGRISHAYLRARIMSWIGHAMHGNTWRLRRSLFRLARFASRSSTRRLE